VIAASEQPRWVAGEGGCRQPAKNPSRCQGTISASESV
jgi:hypothetical protein